MRRLLHTALASAALALAMVLGPGLGTAAAQAAQLVKVGDFDTPIYVGAAPEDKDRLFVVERGGRVEVVRDGKTLDRSFLRIPGGVSTDGERGLQSIAFSPNYENNRRFYVFYTTNPGGDLRVDEFRRREHNANRADPDTRRRVIRIEHSQFSNHNGGQLQFGPDGELYISTGDGGGGNDPLGNGQNIDSLLGKLLRIDPRERGDRSYRIPSSNPFVDRPGQNEVFAYGLRNPYRFSFDRGGGALVIGDVGQNRTEEVDVRAPGAPGGANFGWVCFEGSRPTPGVQACNPPNHVPPAFEYDHDNGRCSITGGYVARRASLGSLNGRYVYGDFCTGEVRSVVGSDDRSAGVTLDQFSLASFGEDAVGCLYTVSLDGRVSRLTEDPGAGGCAA